MSQSHFILRMFPKYIETHVQVFNTRAVHFDEAGVTLLVSIIGIVWAGEDGAIMLFYLQD